MAKVNDSKIDPGATARAQTDVVKRGIEVTAASHRRRAGFAFGPTPTVLTEDDIDEEKLAILIADPLLSIRPHVPKE